MIFSFALFGVLPIDRLDLQQREEPLLVLRRTHLARHDDRRSAIRTAGSATARRRCLPGRADSCTPGERRNPKPSGRISSTPSPNIEPLRSAFFLRISKMISCFLSVATVSTPMVAGHFLQRQDRHLLQLAQIERLALWLFGRPAVAARPVPLPPPSPRPALARRSFPPPLRCSRRSTRRDRSSLPVRAVPRLVYLLSWVFGA